jgi:hypothetical protein
MIKNNYENGKASRVIFKTEEMSVIEEEYTPFKNKKKGIIIINQDGKFSENLDLLTKNETINIDKSQSINF